ncbi:hypothetical protein [Flavobacterium sp. GNP002]
MGMITEDLFVNVIESIRMQMDYDKGRHNALCDALGVDDGLIPFYDNSVLIKSLIAMLQLFFPRNADGFCEIEHYCFDMNFGRLEEQQAISPAYLYCQLVSDKEVMVSTHPLIE